MSFKQFVDKCKVLKVDDEIIIISKESPYPLNPFKVEYPYTLKIKNICSELTHVTIVDFNNEELTWLLDKENYHLIDFPSNRKNRIDNLNL